MTLSGTSLLTTALAPIATLFPMFIFPNSFAPGPIYTLSPIIGALSGVQFSSNLE